MNQEFAQFLARKDKEVRDYNTCFHSKDEWCQSCVNFGVSVTDPYGGQGRIMTNDSSITQELIDNLGLKRI